MYKQEISRAVDAQKNSFQYDRTGPQLFHHAPFIGDGAINWWCATYVSVTDPLKKERNEGEKKTCPGRAFNPGPLGHSAAFYHYARAACTKRQYNVSNTNHYLTSS